MKCNCGDPQCTTTLNVDHAGEVAILIVERKEGDRSASIAVYLTPNDIVALMRELKHALKKIIDQE